MSYINEKSIQAYRGGLLIEYKWFVLRDNKLRESLTPKYRKITINSTTAVLP